jgi:hypothetical protein
VLGTDAFRGGDALGRVGRRHPDVGQHRVRRQLPDGCDQRPRILDQPHQVHVVDLGQQGGSAGADQVIVLGDTTRSGCVGAMPATLSAS